MAEGEEDKLEDCEEAPEGDAEVAEEENKEMEEGEEDGEEEEGEEEDDIEDEVGYTFKFKDGENPLDFVEDNAFSVQPYKQFERLEYEALAEKKRKALADGQP